MRLHSLQEPLCPAPERGSALPAHVVRKQARCLDTRASTDIPECRQAAYGASAEQITAAPLHLATPDQQSDNKTAEEPGRHRLCVAPFCPPPHIVLLAARACAMVTPSAYSRSPPTGSPRAI